MAFDVDPKTHQRDEEDWVPWTSVAKSGTLSTNAKTKLHFPDGSPIWQYEIVAENEKANPPSPLISVTPGTPSSTDTVLNIHGNLGPNNTIETALVLVKMNDSTHQTVWKMKVMVLPAPQPIEITFQTELNDEPFHPNSFPGIAKPAEIEAEINARFAPAAVGVHAVHQAWEKEPRLGDCRFYLKQYVRSLNPQSDSDRGRTDRGKNS